LGSGDEDVAWSAATENLATEMSRADGAGGLSQEISPIFERSLKGDLGDL
jgi:hypothetical protein